MEYFEVHKYIVYCHFKVLFTLNDLNGGKNRKLGYSFAELPPPRPAAMLVHITTNFSMVKK